MSKEYDKENDKPDCSGHGGGIIFYYEGTEKVAFYVNPYFYLDSDSLVSRKGRYVPFEKLIQKHYEKILNLKDCKQRQAYVDWLTKKNKIEYVSRHNTRFRIVEVKPENPEEPDAPIDDYDYDETFWYDDEWGYYNVHGEFPDWEKK